MNDKNKDAEKTKADEAARKADEAARRKAEGEPRRPGQTDRPHTTDE